MKRKAREKVKKNTKDKMAEADLGEGFFNLDSVFKRTLTVVVESLEDDFF